MHCQKNYSTNALTSFLSLFIVLFFCASSQAADVNDKGSSDPLATDTVWDLGDLYPDIASWDKDRENIAARIETLTECKGKLGDSADKLASCLNDISETYKDLLHLYVYSFLARDTDFSNAQYLERASVAQMLVTQMIEATSFVSPELIAIGEEKLSRFQKQTDKLADHDFFIRKTLHMAPYTLSDAEEKILAATFDTMQTPSSVYDVLTNAEMPMPTVTLSDGNEVVLTPAGYSQYRAVDNRDDRKLVFDQFWETYQKYRQTLGLTLEGQVKNDVLMARLRGFDSALQRAQAEDNIPQTVYHALVDTVNEHLDSLHRLVKLRQRVLGLKESHYYDIYPAVVPLDRTYSLEETKALTIAALQPLGEDYIKTFTDAVNQNWMHVYPSPGKRSGAYVMGAAYDAHPYMLLNFDDTIESVSTFAHEWGHAMHSLLANRNQPFTKADYATFTAEIASTANEVLLFEYLRNNAKTDQERLHYLFKELNQLRGTFFRQTQFAEFELAIHEHVENGGALSGDKLNTMYGDLLKRYFGHDKGVMIIDDAYTAEWAYIPHFYRNFYVYQYATSISAAYYLMDRVLNDGEEAQQQYLDILRAGGSDYPYEILLAAGVDMASKDVYLAVIERMNRLMDEAERILDK
ncbi:oligoendopeptidase F [Porticoccus litoralis]|uniref:Oligopeptidase F n=1 Tax=Porticoccus litoralis TaxID=434086 RepID=A0AAW8B159_9GAMM|nr:oligoendopeptidase F [Porticoccus litoralis]MDP1519365.1 oligoendopeptidase F [Porticoccus litoralis]